MSSLSEATSELVLSLASGGKIVAAITRYPVARLRAGDSQEKYNKAAETAFTGKHRSYRIIWTLLRSRDIA